MSLLEEYRASLQKVIEGHMNNLLMCRTEDVDKIRGTVNGLRFAVEELNRLLRKHDEGRI